MKTDQGTIRQFEARQVVKDLLDREGVSKAAIGWKGSSLHMLVGSRKVIVNCPAGLTYYGLQAALRHVEAAISDLRRHRDARQIDLEDAIREKATA